MSNNGRLLDQAALDQHYNEDALLGALLINPAMAAEVAAVVPPEAFTRTDERTAYQHLVKPGLTADTAVRVVHSLHLSELPADRIGMLVTQAPSDPMFYADELRKSLLRRKLESVFKRHWNACLQGADPSEITTTITEELSELQGEVTAGHIAPRDYYDMLESNPALHQPVIDGLLRKGETCNVIAAPKVGKSFLSVGLAWSVAEGRPWLGFDVDQGRVLVIDNELHEPTLSHRIDNVAYAMQIPHADRKGKIDCIPLRGKMCDINDLHSRLMMIKPGTYKLVILDALYRTLPAGASENDNAAMMAIYNRLDQYAARLDSAFVVVHHSSKGNQADKGITDVGAGAGAIARAADSHVVIRPHESEGLAVFEAKTRSFKSPEPLSIAFEYPMWYATSDNPTVKAGGSSADKQQRMNREADEAIEKSLKDGKPLSKAELRGRTGMGESRVSAALFRLQQANKVRMKRLKSRKTGKRADRFEWVDCTDGCTDGCTDNRSDN